MTADGRYSRAKAVEIAHSAFSDRNALAAAIRAAEQCEPQSKEPITGVSQHASADKRPATSLSKSFVSFPEALQFVFPEYSTFSMPMHCVAKHANACFLIIPSLRIYYFK